MRHEEEPRRLYQSVVSGCHETGRLNTRTSFIRRAAVVLICAVSTGCSLAPKTEQPATYDLGAPRNPAAAKPGIAAVLYLPEANAPAWLNGPGIVYRLNYENPPRPQPYALARWSASPASLLTERLRNRFAAAVAKGIVTGPDGVRADYLVRVELEDFSQSFDSPDSSRVAVQARVSLVNLATRALIAQRVFAAERTAPSPDARGAVSALSAASDEFVEAVVKWTDVELASAARK